MKTRYIFTHPYWGWICYDTANSNIDEIDDPKADYTPIQVARILLRHSGYSHLYDYEEVPRAVFENSEYYIKGYYVYSPFHDDNLPPILYEHDAETIELVKHNCRFVCALRKIRRDPSPVTDNESNDDYADYLIDEIPW